MGQRLTGPLTSSTEARAWWMAASAADRSAASSAPALAPSDLHRQHTSGVVVGVCAARLRREAMGVALCRRGRLARAKPAAEPGEERLPCPSAPDLLRGPAQLLPPALPRGAQRVGQVHQLLQQARVCVCVCVLCVCVCTHASVCGGGTAKGAAADPSMQPPRGLPATAGSARKGWQPVSMHPAARPAAGARACRLWRPMEASRSSRLPRLLCPYCTTCCSHDSSVCRAGGRAGTGKEVGQARRKAQQAGSEPRQAATQQGLRAGRRRGSQAGREAGVHGSPNP